MQKITDSNAFRLGVIKKEKPQTNETFLKQIYKHSERGVLYFNYTENLKDSVWITFYLYGVLSQQSLIFSSKSDIMKTQLNNLL